MRGEATRPDLLDEAKGLSIPVGGISAVVAALGATYGLCMGSFALFKVGGAVAMQALASAVKVPALFGLTLLVTFPSLYVFNALVGSRLTLGNMLRLLVASMGVLAAVLASLGPIVAFFSVMTTSYPFVVLLNVAIFGVSGLLGLGFLLQTLRRLSRGPRVATRPPEIAGEPGAVVDWVPSGALEPIDDAGMGKHVKLVFRCWVVLFGLVGAQMGWVLRPFVGDPTGPVQLFRAES